MTLFVDDVKFPAANDLALTLQLAAELTGWGLEARRLSDYKR
jgi:hypothetical protein